MNEAAIVDAVPDYVYTTYIRATPEQVWEALTDPELTARYWGHAQVSDWTVGARVEHVRTDGSGTADAAGTVVEADPPRRLAFGFGEPGTADDPVEAQSIVSFDMEPGLGIVKLTLTQRNIRTAADRDAIGEGWPTVLANLKTFLETGDVLPSPPWEFGA